MIPSRNNNFFYGNDNFSIQFARKTFLTTFSRRMQYYCRAFIGACEPVERTHSCFVHTHEPRFFCKALQEIKTTLQ